MKPPPPIPLLNMLSVPIQNALAIAASTALPLALSTDEVAMVCSSQPKPTAPPSMLTIRELKDRRDPRWNTGRRGKPFLAQGTHGAVASENVICSDVGVGILKAKGNAVDAAIASAFCIGTLNIIKLAKRSIVGPQLAKKLKLVGGYFMLEYPEWSDIFVNPDTGILKAEGEEIRRPAYAKTLERIAKHGPKAFYEGDAAKTMVEKVQSTGGILTEADLAAYKVVVRHPLTGRWGDRIVHTTPNPTCGPTLLSLLNIASLYPDWISSGPENEDTVHRFVEASKFAFGQRTRLGDPAFLNCTAVHDVDRIPTTAEAARIKTLITNSVSRLDQLWSRKRRDRAPICGSEQICFWAEDQIRRPRFPQQYRAARRRSDSDDG
ncbi:Gamma-glutamyltransferase [Ceraceosorus bombacis]|uniref:Gamma-glutamyltransferase n=1 Tax=Ceraceosorus bombacis TaxID=401625 RepID=A0A0P1BGZ9_9BASI|nr:Gamma-glutamyltransferase [Ceraceosorus bombacis]